MIDISIEWGLIRDTVNAIRAGQGIIDGPFIQDQLIALAWLIVALMLWGLIYLFFALPWIFALICAAWVLRLAIRLFIWIGYLR